MADIHNLAKFCRVCGGRLEKAKSRAPTHDCIKHQELMATFSLDVAMDNPAIHPQHFCNSCYAASTRREVAAAKGVPFKHSIQIYEWKEHTEGGCTVSGAVQQFKHKLTVLLGTHRLGLSTC